jgi:hypothetical protein
MGKNLANRLSKIMPLAEQARARLRYAEVKAAEARIAAGCGDLHDHLRMLLTARQEGRPLPTFERASYEGESEDRELVKEYYSQFSNPSESADRLRRKLDEISERQRLARENPEVSKYLSAMRGERDET